MTKTMHGKVRGRTIKFDEDLGSQEGQEVEVEVRFVQHTEKWGEGIRSSAGGWADYPEIDAIMEQIHQGRKDERRPQFGVV